MPGRRRKKRPRRVDIVDDVMGPALEPELAALAPELVSRALGELLSPARIDRLERALDQRLGSLAVVLEDLFDPHNGAAVLRSVEANGVQNVYSIVGQKGFRVSRGVSLGADKWLDVRRTSEVEPCYAALRSRGFCIAAAMADGRVALEELDITRPLALVFGNEHTGLSAAAREGADLSFRIPMAGMVESLNLSVSVAVSVHQCAARRRAYLGRAGDLDDLARAQLRARWYAQDIREPAAVVRRFLERRPG